VTLNRLVICVLVGVAIQACGSHVSGDADGNRRDYCEIRERDSIVKTLIDDGFQVGYVPGASTFAAKKRISATGIVESYLVITVSLAEEKVISCTMETLHTGP
jgi:hypothetical protein